MSADGPRWRPDPALAAILLLALGVRAGLQLLQPGLSTWFDETLHYAMAVVAGAHGHEVLGHWAPGYEAFLAAVFRLAGPHPDAARWAQIAVGTGTVALVYRIAWHAGGRRAALIAGVACALHPSLVAYSQYLFSETLFLALLTGAALALFRSPLQRSRAELATGGLLFGLAALTRSVALYFLPVWLVWAALLGRRREARDAAFVLLVALLVIAPWTLRNAIVHGSFLLVDATAGLTAYWAYNGAPMNMDLGYANRPIAANRELCERQRNPRVEELPTAVQLRELFPKRQRLGARTARSLPATLEEVRDYAQRDHAAYQRCEIARAIHWVRENPALALRRIAGRVYEFWGPNSFLLRTVHWGSYRGGPLHGSYPVLVVWVPLFYAAVVVGALLALGRRRPPPVVEWIALLTVYWTAIHALAVAYSRYRLPLAPLLIVAAATWAARPAWPESRPRALAVGATVALFVASATHYWWTVLP